jgi:hypothetical protein
VGHVVCYCVSREKGRNAFAAAPIQRQSVPLADYREIPSYLANGYSLLMSNKDEGHTPSLIRPQSIHGWSINPKDLFFPAL